MSDLKNRVEIKITIGLIVSFVLLVAVTWFTDSCIFLNMIAVIIAGILVFAPLGCVFMPESSKPGLVAAGIAVLSILADLYLYVYRNQVVRLSFGSGFTVSAEDSRKLFESHIPRAGVMILYGPNAANDKANINGLEAIKEFVKKSADSQEKVKELEKKIEAEKGIGSGYSKYVSGHVSYVSMLPSEKDAKVVNLETPKETTTTPTESK